MKIQLLIGCILPTMAAAQEVKSVISADYLRLIHTDSANSPKKYFVDSTNNTGKAILHYNGGYLYESKLIRNISIGPNNTIVLHPAVTSTLSIGGTASIAVEIQHINQLPALQHQYVQGRSVNGALAWQGPETGELFSYGPSVSNLDFDGSNYPYDVNGKLVPTGTGKGISANSYGNSIFRTTALFTGSAMVQAQYQRGYQHKINGSFSAAQSRENSFIINNKNRIDHITGALEVVNKDFTISSRYDYRQQNFSNSNRNGFLNRAYQNALLTPISFDNSQGNTIGNAQRSYSPQADNPLFLLQNNGHFFLQQQHNASLGLEQKLHHFKIKLAQAYEKVLQHSNEDYKPGTAFFANGFGVDRTAREANYFLNANTQYTIPFKNNRFTGTATANYIFADNQSSITYSNSPSSYRYQRSSHDASLGFSSAFRKNMFETGLSLANKIYASNTATQAGFFLPSASGFVRFNSIFPNTIIKLSTGYNRFNSELPINQSFASTNLLRYSMGNALQYLPVTEVNSFNQLSPVEHREYTAAVELNYAGKLSFLFDWFTRQTTNDIFPILHAGQLQLANLASHRNQGFELQLTHTIYKRNFSFSNAASFVCYRTEVTAVQNGSDFTPISGFSDVHKAIVKGEPLGVIVGNAYLKDAHKNVLIGADGFPLVNPSPAVIGNPNPDFTVKMSHRLNYKNWDLNIDWEWRKGGDIWNGTQALLDYYGRSANSANLRNTTNYVFSGVQANGSHNSIPVSFYDPALPFSQNRWVRYGPGGVAEAYIQKADCIRLNNIGISYKPKAKIYRQLVLTLYVHNVMLWSAYKGADPSQLLNDQPGSSGLDFFNLPSYRSMGINASLKF